VPIDNHPGASGMPGTERVARSTPEGHTMLLTDAGNLIMTGIVHPNVPHVVALANREVVREGCFSLGTEGAGNSPAAFGEWLRGESARWTMVAKKANVQFSF